MCEKSNYSQGAFTKTFKRLKTFNIVIGKWDLKNAKHEISHEFYICIIRCLYTTRYIRSSARSCSIAAPATDQTKISRL